MFSYVLLPLVIRQFTAILIFLIPQYDLSNASSVFQSDTSLLMVYCSALLEAGLETGPNSRRTIATVAVLDRVVGDFMSRLPAGVDLVVLSDHGIEAMADRPDKEITKFVDKRDLGRERGWRR